MGNVEAISIGEGESTAGNIRSGTIGLSDSYQVVNSYYLSSALVWGDETIIRGTPLSETEFCDATNFEGFDFDSIWEIGVTDGYPYPTLKENPHIILNNDDADYPAPVLAIDSQDGENVVFIWNYCKGAVEYEFIVTYPSSETTCYTIPATDNPSTSYTFGTTFVSDWTYCVYAVYEDGTRVASNIVVGDKSEIQLAPTVTGLQDNYTVTQGESLTVNFTVTAGDGANLKVVTVQNSVTGINCYRQPDISANSHTVNCAIPVNGLDVGTHKFIIYASADNYTVTDNNVAMFTVTVKEKTNVDEPQSLIERTKYVIVCNEHNTNYKYDDSDYNYGSVTINDNGASAIGIFQWREGRTFDLLNAIVNCDLITQDEVKEILGTGNFYDDIVNGNRNDWSKRKLTSEEAEKVKTLLLTPAGINEQMYMAQKNAEEYCADAVDCGITQEAAKIVYADARNIGKGYADEIVKSAVAKVGGDGSKVTWELLLKEYASHEKLSASGYKQRRDRLERLLTEWYGSSTDEPPVVEPDELVEPLEVVVYDSNENVVKEGDTLNGEYTVVISKVPSAYQHSVMIQLQNIDTGKAYTCYATKKSANEFSVTFNTSLMQESSYSLSAFALSESGWNDDYRSYGYLNFDTENDAIYGFKLNDKWVANGETIRLTVEEAKEIEIVPSITNNLDYKGGYIVHPINISHRSSCTISGIYNANGKMILESHVIKDIPEGKYQVMLSVNTGDMCNISLIVGDIAKIPKIEGNVFQQDDKTQPKEDAWYNYEYGWYYNKKGKKVTATIGSSGCGLLSITNAVYYLRNEFIHPIELADFSQKNGLRINDVGTSPDLAKNFFESDEGKKYALTVGETTWRSSNTTWFDKLAKHLSNGGVAIGNVPGHFIAIVDYNSESKEFLIYDSAASLKGNSIYGSWKTREDISKTYYNDDGDLCMDDNYLKYYILLSKNN